MDELINRYRTSINPPYNWKDYLNLVFTFLLLLGIPAGLYLSQQQQDIRRQAQVEIPPQAQQPPPGQAASVLDEILLKFKQDIPETAKENIRNSHGLKVESVIEQIGVEKVKVAPEAKDRVIEVLNNNPNIEFAEPNFIGELALIPNDPAFPTYQNFYNSTSNFGGPLWWIQATKAWDMTTGSSSVPIAILDTGINKTHEDLQSKLWVNADEIAGNGVDDDSNGYVDDVNGWNTYSNNNNISGVNGHGTWVSGVAGAATNNSKGMASVSWQSPIMMVRMTDDVGSFNSFTLSNAIIYAAENGAKAVNVSAVISTPSSQTITDAVDRAWNKGAIITAAVGNGNFGQITAYPARLPNVIAVGATNSNDGRWTYTCTDPITGKTRTCGSNYGTGLDVMAPGSAIYTTVHTSNTAYTMPSGTSFSAPHVAALVALIFAANSYLTNQQVMDIINQTADKVGDISYDDTTTNNCNGWNQYYGCGRINAYKALLAATGGTLPPPSPTPTIGPTNTPTPTQIPDTIPPTITINTTQPLIIASKGNTRVPATASDSSGISSIQILLDSTLLKTCTGVTSCTANINGSKTSTGTHTITVIAKDNSPARNTATTSITAVKQ